MFIGKRAAAKVAASNYALVGTLKENSEREVAARDRVDITLAEYLKMKEDIEKLSEENLRLKTLFGKIGLPFDVPIIPDSICKYTCSSSGFMDFTQRFLIEFKCDMSMLSAEQRCSLTETFYPR